jgi:transketolase
LQRLTLTGSKLINRSFSHGKHSAKFEAFDWDVDIKEGNNIEAIIAGMTDAKSRTEKENQYVLHTEMGNSRLYDVQSCMHGKPNDAQLEMH